MLTSFLAAFPVRTFPQLGKAQELTESDPVCGHKWQESLVKFDLDSSRWKTHLCLWEEDLPESSVILPKWGMMRAGVLWERLTAAHPISGIESGSLGKVLLPTPCASDADKWNLKTAQERKRDGHQVRLVNALSTQEERVGGRLNPMWVEWLMGWPLGWTDLGPLEMGKFHSQRQLLGQSSLKDKLI